MAIKSADQITIVDVTDAYSVGLTSEAYTFVGGVSGAASGLKCTTNAYAYCGTNQCASVSVAPASIICPTGISATVANSGSASPTITFTTTATISTACEATIPVTVDGITINKKFSFAVAKTGATGAKGDTGAAGKGIKSVVDKYAVSSSNTTEPTSWSDDVPTMTSTNRYLWNYEIVTYTDNSTSESAKRVIGVYGTTGSTGKGIKSITNKFLASASASDVTASTSGWTSDMQTTTITKKYLWSYEVITYTDNSTSSTTPRVIGTHGATGAKGDTGAAGADAITLTITSSNGTIFKNSSGSTVLTAHVFVGAVEQSITDAGVCGSLGSIKWYEGTNTTAVATAKTLTISASDITNSVVYTAQLE